MPDQFQEATMADAPPLLHIIAQKAWHDPSFIIGTRDALERLKNAIDAALSDGVVHCAEVFAADGEGYSVIVRCVSYEQMDSVPLGYTSPEARCRTRVWPPALKPGP